MDQPDRRIRAYALKEGEGWIYRFFGIDFIVKAGEIRAGGGVAFMEYVTKKGEEPESHTHNNEDEIFYVLDGALTFRCGEETFDVEKGGFIFLPHGIEHGYAIRSQEPARLIIVTAPVMEAARAGWGGFVADIESGQGELIAKPAHAG